MHGAGRCGYFRSAASKLENWRPASPLGRAGAPQNYNQRVYGTGHRKGLWFLESTQSGLSEYLRRSLLPAERGSGREWDGGL